MDPNANLAQQLDIAKRILALIDGDGEISGTAAIADRVIALAEELAERVEALDHWITGGGFLPERWAEVQGKGPTS
jgi:hypothetical protein